MNQMRRHYMSQVDNLNSGMSPFSIPRQGNYHEFNVKKFAAWLDFLDFFHWIFLDFAAVVSL